MEMAQQNTYARKKLSRKPFPRERASPQAKYMPMQSRQTIIPDTPQYMSFLRPTLSMMNTASTVVSIFTTPTSTVENIGLSKPASWNIFGP